MSEIDQLRLDNQELRGQLTSARIVAANIWKDLFSLYDGGCSDRRMEREILRIIKTLNEMQGLRKLVEARVRQRLAEVDKSRDEDYSSNRAALSLLEVPV